jgi:hypothetical protein
MREKEAAQRPFFHRLRPLTSITETDAQISGGETRQDYKDIRRFPLMAPSCALLFRPAVYRYLSAFMGSVALSHSTPDTQFG